MAFEHMEKKLNEVLGQPEPRFYADALDVGMGLNSNSNSNVDKNDHFRFFDVLTGTPEFRYVPVKSTEFREQIVNPIFVSTQSREKAKTRFGEALFGEGPITCTHDTNRKNSKTYERM